MSGNLKANAETRWLDDTSPRVYCPLCQEGAVYLKTCRLTHRFVFVPPHHCHWEDRTIIACPDCIRYHIFWRAIYSWFWANVVSPILAIHYLTLVRRTYAPGNDVLPDVLQAWVIAANPVFPEPAQPRRIISPPILYTVVLAPILLAIMGVGSFFLLPDQFQNAILFGINKAQHPKVEDFKDAVDRLRK
jgi:hypothetical protein